jgi:hypothetical protein
MQPSTFLNFTSHDMDNNDAPFLPSAIFSTFFDALILRVLVLFGGGKLPQALQYNHSAVTRP